MADGTRNTDLSADDSPYVTWDRYKDRATDFDDAYPDKKMVPVVEQLRAAGIVTYQSCQGHKLNDYVRSSGLLWLAGTALSDDALTRLARLRTRSDVRVFDSVSREYALEHAPIIALTWEPDRFEDAIIALFRELKLRLVRLWR